MVVTYDKKIDCSTYCICCVAKEERTFNRFQNCLVRIEDASEDSSWIINVRRFINSKTIVRFSSWRKIYNNSSRRSIISRSFIRILKKSIDKRKKWIDYHYWLRQKEMKSQRLIHYLIWIDREEIKKNRVYQYKEKEME